jgi:hypothetical protein
MIRQNKADYVVALKSNHPTLYNKVKDWFETAKTQDLMGIEMSYPESKRDIIASKVEKSGRYHLPN